MPTSLLEMAVIFYSSTYRNGILLGSFLSHMLDSFHKSGVTGYQLKQNEAVDLMKWFGFLAQISSNTKILEEKIKKNEEEVYIVPSLLPDDITNEKKIPVKGDDDVRIIYYYFPDNFLPSMLFNQVVAMCINRNEEKREDLLWLRKGKVKMVLGQGQYYCVSLCEEMCSIQLTFLLHGKSHSAKQRQELFHYIQSKIEVLMNKFMQAATKPEAYIPCYYKDCNKLHAELQLLCDGEEQHCPCEEKPLPGDYYCDLFPDLVPVGDFHSDSLTGQSDGTSTCLDQSGILKQVPEMGDINKIVVPKIQAEWEDVAYALRYKIPTVKAIKAKYNDDPKKCCKELLTDWLSTDNGVGPKTWSTLLDKLKEVEDLAAVTNEIMDEVKKLTHS